MARLFRDGLAEPACALQPYRGARQPWRLDDEVVLEEVVRVHEDTVLVLPKIDSPARGQLETAAAVCVRNEDVLAGRSAAEALDGSNGRIHRGALKR